MQSSAHFGILRHWKQDKVLDYLRALEKANYLTVTGGDYPCVMLTNSGEDFIEYPTAITLSLRSDPEITPVKRRSRITAKSTAGAAVSLTAPAVSAPAPATGDRRLLERADLRSELKQKRLDLSRERQQKAFQIFSDAVCKCTVVFKSAICKNFSSFIKVCT